MADDAHQVRQVQTHMSSELMLRLDLRLERTEFAVRGRKPDVAQPGLKAQVNMSGNQKQLVRVCLKEKATVP